MISSPIGPCDQLLDLLSCQNFDLSQMMKKTDDFVWNDAANAAFEDLKR